MADRIVYWFRNDLRLLDNEALSAACKNASEVVPVFVFDPRQFENTRLGFRRTGVLRAQLLIDCVKNLRNNLRSKGGDLLIRIGEPEKVVARLAEELEAHHIYASKEIAPEETRIESSLSKTLKVNNIDIKLFWMDTIIHPSELPFSISHLPDSFEVFRNHIEPALVVKQPISEPEKINIPKQIELGELPALSDLGINEAEIGFAEKAAPVNEAGESAALETLNRYLQTPGKTDYLNTVIDSGVSQWLSLGCISPRFAYRSALDAPAAETRDKLLIDLLERDYFHFTLLRFGPRLFKPSGVRHFFAKRWLNDNSLFYKWVEGKTDNTDVNEAMNQLKNTGNLPTSKRLLAANYLANTLDINWTWGAMYFESNLKDYEPSVSWCKWNKIAGVGQD